MDSHRVTASLVRNAAAEVLGKRITPNWLPWAAGGSTAVVLLCATVALWTARPWSSSSHTAPAGTHPQTTNLTRGSGDAPDTASLASTPKSDGAALAALSVAPR